MLLHPRRDRRGAASCDQLVCVYITVCLCVGLSASISLEPLDRSSRNFFCSSTVTVAVARSSSGGEVSGSGAMNGRARKRWSGSGARSGGSSSGNGGVSGLNWPLKFRSKVMLLKLRNPLQNVQMSYFKREKKCTTYWSSAPYSHRDPPTL